MSTFIVMTAEQAMQVEGDSTPGAALYCVPLTDGRYILPAVVLNDPAHADKHDLLASYPQMEFGEIEPYLQPETC